MKTLIIIFLLTFFISLAGFFMFWPKKETIKKTWSIQSIDTMKYSRDFARQTLSGKEPSYAIQKQVEDIAGTGANYIAIDTPYDDEFLPVLKLWVKEARKNHLKIIFRGNFSGWEGWFGYKKIGEKTHLSKTKDFILKNSSLFENGDIFSACPECENGIGYNIYDSRNTGRYRNFLLEELDTEKNAFKSINKDVTTNLFSMNADIAKVLMDKDTTQKFGGVVVIDHYVRSPAQLSEDITEIAQKSGGKVFLGEFGAPLPNINGTMSTQEQDEWMKETLSLLSKNKNLIGVNYWVNAGGTTAIWNDKGEPTIAVSELTKYYKSSQ